MNMHLSCLRAETLSALAIVGLSTNFLFASNSALSSEVSGPTQTGPICMQKVFGTPVTNANKLNCTANDIRLSKAVAVSPSSCIRGSTFDLTATFQVDVTANSRYDAGFFFRTDGGKNARGDGTEANGMCSLSALDPARTPPLNNTSGLNLDGDSAGDLNAGSYLVTYVIPGVACESDDPGPDPQLSLPNCTSWHSNQGTVTNINNAFDFKPDTKSKCVCDDTFSVPVTVEDATITVTKSAMPSSVPETGGEVLFKATIKNDSAVASLTVTTVVDTVLGPNDAVSTDDVTTNLGAIPACDDEANQPSASFPGPCSPTGKDSCPDLVGDVLAPTESKSCYFSAWINGDDSDIHTNDVEICGSGNQSNNNVCDEDRATVAITNTIDGTPTVSKDGDAKGCTLSVKYDVVVSNPSTIDATTVESLTDNQFDDLTKSDPDGSGTRIVATNCEIGKKINKGGIYSCSFTAALVMPSGCDIDHTNIVTASGIDEDNDAFGPIDSNSVNVTTITTITGPVVSQP